MTRFTNHFIAIVLLALLAPLPVFAENPWEKQMQEGACRNIENLPIFNVNFDELASIKEKTLHRNNKMHAPGNIESVKECNICMYLDFFENSTEDANGYLILNDVSEWLFTSAPVTYKEKNGKLTLNNLFGISQFNPEIKKVDDVYRFELGQTLYSVASGYSYKLAAIVNNNITLNGYIELEQTDFGFLYPDFIGVAVFEDNTGTFMGWTVLSSSIQLLKPNATISYTVDRSGDEIEVFNRIYCEYSEGQDVIIEDGTTYVTDALYVSSLIYSNEGYVVKFKVYEGYGIADECTAYPSFPYGDGYTGIFQLCVLYPEGDGYTVQPYVVGQFDDDYLNFNFPVSYNNAPYESAGWIIFAPETQLNYGLCTPATITFDYPINNPNSIPENMVDLNNDEPQIFYNLQGIQISNPEAGQIYIVKKGSKTHKTINR